MNRGLLALAALLAVSYVALLAFGSQGRDGRTADAQTVPTRVESAPPPQEGLDEPELPDPPWLGSEDTEESAAVADEPVATIAATAASPQQSAPAEVLTPAAEAIRSLAYSSSPDAVATLAQTLRSDRDRRHRLLAVDSLLLLGRRSSVDPTIRKALQDATSDSDQLVAQNARSALVEVEHCEPTSE
jgi:hypothetical protein